MILKREEEEAAEAYKAFVESFDESEKGLNRSWVKGGIVNPEKGKSITFEIRKFVLFIRKFFIGTITAYSQTFIFGWLSTYVSLWLQGPIDMVF